MEHNLGDIFKDYNEQLIALESYVESIEELLLERHKRKIEEDDDILHVATEITKQLSQKTLDLIETSEQSASLEDNEKSREHRERLEKIIEETEEIMKSPLNVDIDMEDDNLALRYYDRQTKERFDKYFTSIDEVRDHTNLLYRSSLISLAVTFELLITNIVHYRAFNHPQSINISSKKLTLNEIEKIGSIEEAKNYLVEEYVTEFMRQSNIDWITTLKKDYKVKLDPKIEGYENLINETFNRRNLVVHGGGKVNNIYLTKVEKELREGVEKGDAIEINKSYIVNRINVFRVYGLSLMYAYWMRMEKANNDRALQAHRYAFDMLNKEKYIEARLLYETILQDNLSQEEEYMIKINYWQTYKWNNELDLVEKEIENIDFSAARPVYQMCKDLLLDDNDSAIIKLRRVLASEEYTFEELMEWPIISPLMKYEEFKEIAEEEGVNFEHYEDANN